MPSPAIDLLRTVRGLAALDLAARLYAQRGDAARAEVVGRAHAAAWAQLRAAGVPLGWADGVVSRLVRRQHARLAAAAVLGADVPPASNAAAREVA